MVYNGLGFAEAPFQSLIKFYRNECQCFDTVKEAAFDFLKYLNDFGKKSPARVKGDAISALVAPILQRMANRFQSELQRHFFNTPPAATPAPAPPLIDPVDIQKVMVSILDTVIGVFERVYQPADDALFVGGGAPTITPEIEGVLAGLMENQFKSVSDEQKGKLLAIAKLV